MTDQPTSIARPWWCYLRFSLRALIATVLVIGCAMAWVVSGARVQRRAVAAITKGGGRVYYDWQCKDGVPISNAKPPWPRWLVRCVGIDYFSNVSYVAGLGSDTELFHVGHLTHLERLNLFESEASDTGLSYLLDGTAVTDAGLVHLKGLTGLESLSLNDTRVTDAGLANLTRLVNLEWLLVDDAGVTAVGWTKLQSSLPKRLKHQRSWPD